ncbi:MAG: NAD+ synthase [Gemmatimonadetes bacterium]|nr:NAD+ synthase [Gemmatimonadota bacterium]MYB58263.1 NAD+ synthase [Gemmatimonadota bacterium]
MRLALSQINVTVGDLAGNREKILDHVHRARDLGAHVVVFPELAIPGYPPEDLLFKPRFIQSNLDVLNELVRATQGVAAIFGFVDRHDDIYNAAAIACDGRLIDVYHKTYLPNYGVFDEDRYFQSGKTAGVYRLNGITFGVTICEDIWYPGGPAREQALAGDAEVLINISSSPFHDGKELLREQMIATRATDNSAVLAFCNLVGGQDELIFDGGSLIVDQEGRVVARAPRFEEDLLVADVDVEAVFRNRLHDSRRRKEKRDVSSPVAIDLPDLKPKSVCLSPSERPDFPRPDERLKNIYDALVLGTRDYVLKNGFEKVFIGLSGGIDSALVTAVAYDALGQENVVCVTMPTQFSSEGTFNDALRMAGNLDIRILTLPIQKLFDQYLGLLADEFGDLPSDTAEENIQPRIRGTLLMALANKFRALVLAPGNKSELSMGYATLYGDMAGGFAVIKDIYKTLVYDLAHYRNGLSDHPVIPVSIIERPPTAELRDDQKDTDSLPPYPVLDPILKAYVEDDTSLQDIIALGYDEELVTRVIRTVDVNEYKRRQAPPGIKITPRAFGRDRRLPITNRCREY